MLLVQDGRSRQRVALMLVVVPLELRRVVVASVKGLSSDCKLRRLLVRF